jgi:hypothetical protein
VISKPIIPSYQIFRLTQESSDGLLIKISRRSGRNGELQSSWFVTLPAKSALRTISYL